MCSYIAVHESLHSVIWESYGVDSHYGINLEGIYNEANSTQMEKLSDIQLSTATLAHNINEIVGYSIFICMTLIICIAMGMVELR
jgi:hypothetical protein